VAAAAVGVEAGLEGAEAAGLAGFDAAGVFSVLGMPDSPLGSEEDLDMPVAPVEDFLESLI